SQHEHAGPACSRVGRRRGVRGVGPFPTTPLRTGRARFPWHPALQCSSCSPCGTSGMDVLVADAADDKGLAAASGHSRDPFGLVFFPLGVEVFEGTYVMHLDLVPGFA